MIPKNKILDIVNSTIYNNQKDIKWLISKLVIDKEDELFLMTNDIYLRLSISNTTFILEEIKISDNLKHQKKCFKLIGNFIEMCKNDDGIQYFEVSSIISSKMYSICNYYKMEDIPTSHYGDIDDDYDFDGLFGSKIIKTE